MSWYPAEPAIVGHDWGVIMRNQVADRDRAIALGAGRRRTLIGVAAAVTLAIAGQTAPGDVAAAPGGSAKPALPQLEPAEPGELQECASLTEFDFPSTEITSASVVAAGTLQNRGEPIGEHCRVTGYMNERISPVDGRTYRIGFEMRLPSDWSGRYLYQANGGLDGSVPPAIGGVGGGESGLQMGMAVISSDAGHSSALGQTPFFGLDPQARLDYGYQAVGTLTPMAKALVTAGYGRPPDRSYMTGGSNGGRHTMVGAARYADEYDGFLAVAPGFNLPQAAVAQIWEAQQLNTVATTPGDLSTALTPAERQTIADAILSTCDKFDGLVDGMVQASERCQQVFSLARDVPTCADDRDGTCLTAEQKRVLADIYEGARTSTGAPIYSSFPYDPGLTQGSWSFWQFFAPLVLDSGAVGFVFTSPPDARLGAGYTLSVDVDRIAANIYESSGIYAESAMEFMTPPDPARLDTLRDRGGKLMVVHGAADGVFSVDDTASWYEELDGNYRNQAGEFARYYEVTGMGHVRGGPATDQYDALQALVDWVEQGDQPDRITAWVDPNNGEVPAEWSSDRSRPLCVYPAIARYQQGDPESATSFMCTGDKPQTNGR
jgi:pimeloyl-ACP methyl ester carboxylesterase